MQFFLHVFVWCQSHCPNICFWALNQVWLNVACKFPLKRDQTNTHQSWACWLLAVKWSVCCESRPASSCFVEYSRGEDAGHFSMIKVHRWTSSPSMLRNVSLSSLSLTSSSARGCQWVKRSICNCRLPSLSSGQLNTSGVSYNRPPNHNPLPVWQFGKWERGRRSPSESDPTPSQCASLSFTGHQRCLRRWFSLTESMHSHN